MKRLARGFVSLGMALGLTLGALPALGATVPATIDQQGRFLKMDGTPETGSLTVSFALYNMAAGSTALWTETQPLTLDAAGFYSAQLGSTTPFSPTLFDGTVLYLGITIKGESEMAPRQALVSVPYAFRAGAAVDAVGDIHPTSITVNGKVVVDAMGNVMGGAGIQGPQGATGPTGPAGIKGDPGPEGVTGMIGPAGAMGATGSPGSTGPMGAMGQNGKDGKNGTSTGSLTVLDLEFDEQQGMSFADSSGAGLIAVSPFGGVAVGSTGHTGKAVSFSGGAITIAGPTKIPDSPQIWVEAWIQPQAPLNVTRTIVTKEGSYALKQPQSDVSFQVIGAAAPNAPCIAASSGLGLQPGIWYHVAGWYDGLRVTVAVNGQIRGSAACPNGPILPTPNGAFDVGAASVANMNVTEPYQGTIDEVRVRQVAALAYLNVNRGQNLFSVRTNSASQQWTSIAGSAFSGTTNGGTLLISLALPILNDSPTHATCQVTIDNKWAGSYGNFPNPGDVGWREGLMGTDPEYWHMWTNTKIYSGVPAGTHTFAIQCATNGGTAHYCDTSVNCSLTFVELP